jgi:hypothetical protein
VPSFVFQTIDPPLAAHGSAAVGINSSEKVVGEFTDVNSVTHGYLLSGGQNTTVEDPGSGGFDLSSLTSLANYAARTGKSATAQPFQISRLTVSDQPTESLSLNF